MENLPDWLKWFLSLLGGAGGGGLGVHQYYKTYLKADQQGFDQESDYRNELRQAIDKLRDRQEKYEVELGESRGKYFEMQEKYHKLKLDYEETLRENKKMREEIKRLREEIQKLREKLENNG